MTTPVPSAELVAVDLLRVDIDNLAPPDLDDHIHAASECLRGLADALKRPLSGDSRRSVERLQRKLRFQLSHALQIRAAQQAITVQVTFLKQQGAGGGNAHQP